MKKKHIVCTDDRGEQASTQWTWMWDCELSASLDILQMKFFAMTIITIQSLVAADVLSVRPNEQVLFGIRL